jgi:hypothetical protein
LLTKRGGYFVFVNLSDITTIKGLKENLKPFSLQEKCQILQQNIKHIDKEAEVAVSRGDHALAIWKMAQAEMFDSLLVEFEKELVKEGVRI